MSTAANPTRQDDGLRLLRILADAPAGGLSIPEIQDACTAAGESWSYRTINEVLCDLAAQVAHEKVRVRGQKVTKYSLKRS